MIGQFSSCEISQTWGTNKRTNKSSKSTTRFWTTSHQWMDFVLCIFWWSPSSFAKLEFSQVHKMRNSSIDIKWLFESDFLSLSKRIKCTKQNLFICVWWFQIWLWILKFSIIVCLFTYLFVPHVFLTHATSPNSCYLTARGGFFPLMDLGPGAAVGGMRLEINTGYNQSSY